MNGQQQSLTDYVDRVERSWVRLGVAPIDRRRLVMELEADLAAACEAGAPVDALVATDPVVFAVELARAPMRRSWPRPPSRHAVR